MTKITVKDIEKAMREMVEEAFSWGGESTHFWLVYDPESDTVHYTTEYYVTYRLPALSCEMMSYSPDFGEKSTDILDVALDLAKAPATVAGYEVLPYGFEVPHDVLAKIADLDASTPQVKVSEEEYYTDDEIDEIEEMKEERAAKILEDSGLRDYIDDMYYDEVFEMELKELEEEYPPEALLDEVKDIISGKDELADWYARKA